MCILVDYSEQNPSVQPQLCSWRPSAGGHRHPGRRNNGLPCSWCSVGFGQGEEPAEDQGLEDNGCLSPISCPPAPGPLCPHSRDHTVSPCAESPEVLLQILLVSLKSDHTFVDSAFIKSSTIQSESAVDLLLGPKLSHWILLIKLCPFLLGWALPEIDFSPLGETPLACLPHQLVRSIPDRGEANFNKLSLCCPTRLNEQV